MTIDQLFKCADNIDDSTRVQLFKRSEEQKYYSNDFENLWYIPMTVERLRKGYPNTSIKRFYYDNTDKFTGEPERVMILLEGETI